MQKSTNPLDIQEGGNHYKFMKIQPIEFAIANNLGPCESSIVKYVCRHQVKGREVDIDKIIHYCELIKKFYYNK